MPLVGRPWTVPRGGELQPLAGEPGCRRPAVCKLAVARRLESMRAACGALAVHLRPLSSGAFAALLAAGRPAASAARAAIASSWL